jgi:hypothetical protein
LHNHGLPALRKPKVLTNIAGSLILCRSQSIVNAGGKRSYIQTPFQETPLNRSVPLSLRFLQLQHLELTAASRRGLSSNSTIVALVSPIRQKVAGKIRQIPELHLWHNRRLH